MSALKIDMDGVGTPIVIGIVRKYYSRNGIYDLDDLIQIGSMTMPRSAARSIKRVTISIIVASGIFGVISSRDSKR